MITSMDYDSCAKITTKRHSVLLSSCLAQHQSGRSGDRLPERKLPRKYADIKKIWQKEIFA